MLADHLPMVSGRTLEDTVQAEEDLEEAARLALLLSAADGRGSGSRALQAGW